MTDTARLDGPRTPVKRLWLDLTRKCQLNCVHCYNGSGPAGDHGTMTCEDWLRVVEEAADHGIERVQLIGGEPTLHPDAHGIADHALALGLHVEVYSNLVHITDTWWQFFQRVGVSVATSYYAADPAGHNAVTGRPSHQRTRGNIVRAVALGIRLRVGIVSTGDASRTAGAVADLKALGVTDVGVDHVRPYGRAGGGVREQAAGLCGRCGDGRAAIGPTGDVTPCVMSTWMSVGNVRGTPLAAIVGGAEIARASAAIGVVAQAGDGCDPDDECRPGFPGSGCNPRS